MAAETSQAASRIVPKYSAPPVMRCTIDISIVIVHAVDAEVGRERTLDRALGLGHADAALPALQDAMQPALRRLVTRSSTGGNRLDCLRRR